MEIEYFQAFYRVPNDDIPQRIGHNTGNATPYSLRIVCGVFNIPHGHEDRLKGCEKGNAVYRLYPRRLECLTICRCHGKGNTFSQVIYRP